MVFLYRQGDAGVGRSRNDRDVRFSVGRAGVSTCPENTASLERDHDAQHRGSETRPPEQYSERFDASNRNGLAFDPDRLRWTRRATVFNALDNHRLTFALRPLHRGEAIGVS